jgi:hypothetical protein
VQLRPRIQPPHPAERVLTHCHAYKTATMALNASSHNVTGEKTTANTAPPPELGADVKKDILGAAGEDATGQHAGGRENDKDVEKKEKSAKELEKERKKAEKDAKFKAKKAATAQAGGAAKDGAAAPAKEKKKKGKEEEQLPEYVEETPKGEKKRLQSLDGPFTKAYIPKVVESAWDAWWEAQGFFKPEFAKNGNVKPAGNDFPLRPAYEIKAYLIPTPRSLCYPDTSTQCNRKAPLWTCFGHVSAGCAHSMAQNEGLYHALPTRLRSCWYRHPIGRREDARSEREQDPLRLGQAEVRRADNGVEGRVPPASDTHVETNGRFFRLGMYGRLDA